MQTITLQINDVAALETIRDLEHNHFVRVLDSSDVDSPALHGEPLSMVAFKNWIDGAENERSVSLSEAKEKWASKRKQLQGLMK